MVEQDEAPFGFAVLEARRRLLLPPALRDLEHLLGWAACAKVEMDAPIDLLGI